MEKQEVEGLEIEQYTSGPVWNARQMIEALERRDDASVWEAARKAPSPALFYEDLRDQVSTTIYRAGVKSRHSQRVRMHCALVMIPVILGKPLKDLVDSDTALTPGIKLAHSWVAEWFEHKVEISILNALLGYNEVCVWTPSNMREKLELLAMNKRPTLPLPPNFDFHLTDDVPELVFFVAAIHKPFDWPSLPTEDLVQDQLLAARLAGGLQLCSGADGLGTLEVLPPTFVGEALRTGLIRWIEKIAEVAGIKRWDIEIRNQDLVVLHLEVGNDAVQTTPIPLRSHQLGLDGLDAVLKRVAQLGTGTLTQAQ